MGLRLHNVHFTDLENTIAQNPQAYHHHHHWVPTLVSVSSRLSSFSIVAGFSLSSRQTRLAGKPVSAQSPRWTCGSDVARLPLSPRKTWVAWFTFHSVSSSVTRVTWKAQMNKIIIYCKVTLLLCESSTISHCQILGPFCLH